MTKKWKFYAGHFSRSYCCTAYDRLLAWYCRLYVRLSVCDEVNPTAKLSEQVNRKCSSTNTILQLSTKFPNQAYPFKPLPLKPQTLLSSGEYIKTTVSKRTAKISTSGIAIVNMLHGYSRQRRAIGSFSAMGYTWSFYTQWHNILYF